MARLPPHVPRKAHAVIARITPAAYAWLVGTARATNRTLSDVLRGLIDAARRAS